MSVAVAATVDLESSFCGVSIELIATVQLQLYVINPSFSQVSFVYVNVVLCMCSDL